MKEAKFLKSDLVKLVKEPDNDYDMEAMVCEIKYIGKTGYIANSTRNLFLLMRL